MFNNEPEPAHTLPFWIIGVIFVVFAGAVGYGGWYGYGRINALETELEALKAESEANNAEFTARIASSTALMQESIAGIESVLGEELEEERARLAALQDQLGSFQQEVGTISGNVSTLEKLTKIDKELLQKYSRVFFLNEHYMPSDVVEIPNEFKYHEHRYYTVHTQVYPYLENMLKAAEADGVELYVYSAYRSFDEQEALNDHYTVVYGEGTANQFSAHQGYSEHQLGTTVDLITTGIGGTLPGFQNTEAYTWLQENAHRFGFILSYPEGNDHYVFEPWHWRFVGVQLATDLHKKGIHFYDMQQREIDEYLVNIFE